MAVQTFVICDRCKANKPVETFAFDAYVGSIRGASFEGFVQQARFRILDDVLSGDPSQAKPAKRHVLCQTCDRAFDDFMNPPKPAEAKATKHDRIQV